MTIVRALGAAVCALSVSLPAWAVPGAFTTLNARFCHALAADIALPAGWEKYRASVRACPLTKGGGPAQASLVSVFVDEYYRGLPHDAPWEAFPAPLIIDGTGRCLARVAHLFPVEPPRELVVSAGRWRQGLPTELRFRVKNPAVSGDYSLPTLTWQASTRTYQPSPSASPSNKERTLCP